MTGIPTATISRLVTYLRVLEKAEADLPQQTSGEGRPTGKRSSTLNRDEYISSSAIARESGNSAFQVRKDLAYIYSHKDFSHLEPFGTRGVGYHIRILKRQLMSVLGLNQPWNVVIVGVGRLGQAIANYTGASDYQFQYVGLFDVNPALMGLQVHGLTVQHIDELRDFVGSRQTDREKQVHMGFLAVPPERAQDAAQSLADAGVRGILNFAPVVIQPRTVERSGLQEIGDEWRGVIVENVDFLAGMKRLAFYILTPDLSSTDPEDTDE